MTAERTERRPRTPVKGLPARLRERRLATGIGAVALVAAIAVGLGSWWWGGDEAGVPTTDERPARVVNEAGGYSLVAPQGWAVARDGRTTTVTSPNRDAVLTAGVGGTGPLPEAAALFYQQVARNYDDFTPIGVEGQRIAGRSALLWAGSGTNDNDVGVRFLAITVENQPRHFAISYFTANDPATRSLLPQVTSVVESFRSLRS